MASLSAILLLIVPAKRTVRTTWRASHRGSYATHNGWCRHRISNGIGRRISTVPAGNCAGKMASFSWPKSFCQPGPIGLANSTAMPRPTAPTWQVKSARDSPPDTATISPLIAAFSASASDPANQGEDTTSRLSKEARKRQTLSSGSPGKRPGMKRPNRRDKSQQSTELIGAPTARDPIPNDGVYMLHLQDTKWRP